MTGTDPASFASPQYWDQFAACFDAEPDHGLQDPAVRAAWRRLLQTWLPPNPAVILDAGCGTGSLSVLLAELGHSLTGIDFSPAMVAQAQAKAQAAGVSIHFETMDAARPGLEPGQFDLVICRHLLWALPEPRQVLRNWSALLKPGGRLVLIEGYWGSGGLHAQEVQAMLPPDLRLVSDEDLSARPELWGKRRDDERYLMVVEPAV